jgi:hypothetical protein
MTFIENIAGLTNLVSKYQVTVNFSLDGTKVRGYILNTVQLPNVVPENEPPSINALDASCLCPNDVKGNERRARNAEVFIHENARQEVEWTDGSIQFANEAQLPRDALRRDTATFDLITLVGHRIGCVVARFHFLCGFPLERPAKQMLGIVGKRIVGAPNDLANTKFGHVCGIASKEFCDR